MMLKELAEHMQRVHTDMDRSNSELYNLKKEWNDLRKEHLPNKMKKLGLEKAHLTDIGIASLRVDAECIVMKSMMTELCDWLENSGHGGLIDKHINIKKFESFMKRQCQN